jgi:hypothetical protein
MIALLSIRADATVSDVFMQPQDAVQEAAVIQAQ